MSARSWSRPNPIIVSVVRGNDDNLRGEWRPPSSEKLAAEKVSLELKGAERLWEKPFVGIPQTAIRKPLILTNISSTLNTLAGKLYCRTKQSVAPTSRAETQKNKWWHHWCWNWVRRNSWFRNIDIDHDEQTKYELDEFGLKRLVQTVRVSSRSPIRVLELSEHTILLDKISGQHCRFPAYNPTWQNL